MEQRRGLGTDAGSVHRRDWPDAPQLCLMFLAVLALIYPIPGRGPRLFQRLDPWRRFEGEARWAVMARAGGRCEGSPFLA